MRLQNHDHTTLVHPDAMCTITNVVTTPVGLLSGNANISQVLLEEEEFGRREWYCDVQTVTVHEPFICHSNRLARAICSKKIIIRLNDFNYLFQKTHQPFERLKLSVQKKASTIQTAQAARSKKVISHSNCLSYLLEKSISCLNGLSYPFRKENK